MLETPRRAIPDRLRRLSGNEHAEVTCPMCEGAGFFGNGPYVEFCAFCHGTGVMIDESATLEPERMPVGRERRKVPRNARTSDGEMG